MSETFTWSEFKDFRELIGLEVQVGVHVQLLSAVPPSAGSYTYMKASCIKRAVRYRGPYYEVNFYHGDFNRSHPNEAIIVMGARIEYLGRAQIKKFDNALTVPPGNDLTVSITEDDIPWPNR